MNAYRPASHGAPAVTAEPTFLEIVLARDRIVVICGLIVVIAAAWIWIALGAGMDTAMTADMPAQQMPGMTGMTMSVMTPVSWTPAYAALMFSMWWIMMVAMMLPSATPTLLLFARINRKEKAGGRPYVPTAVFAAGYLAVWAGFSIIAAGLQWALERVGLLSSMMASTSAWLGGAILIAAGLWQLTPMKTVCLRHCRAPLSFLSGHWKPGRIGAFRMGLEHGAYCVGCCWFLMGLLFVGGIMNLYWIAGLAAFVLIEKTVPLGHWVSRVAGAALLVWGAVLLFASA